MKYSFKPLNNFVKFKEIDNTIDSPYLKGYSDTYSLVYPNEGLTEDNQRIWYYLYGIAKHNDELFIDKDNIIMQDDELVANGLLVEKYTFELKQGKFIIGNLDYFKVLKSNTDIPVGAVILAKPYTAYRMNIDGQERFFLNPDMVYLWVWDKINTGKNYKLLKEVKENEAWNVVKDNCGSDNGVTYLFDKHYGTIEINYDNYYLVRIEDIYGRDR